MTPKRKIKTKQTRIERRAMRLYLLFFVFGVVILTMVLSIQWGGNGRPLRELAHRRMYRMDEVPALRGAIYASDGKTILACASPFYNVYFDFGSITPPQSLLKKHNADREASIRSFRDSIMGANRANLIDTLALIYPNHSRGEIIRDVERVYSTVHTAGRGWRNQKFEGDSITQNQLDLLRRLNLASSFGRVLKVEKYQPRYRPYGNLARSTLGSDAYGTGIEGAFDSYLRGKNGISTTVLLYEDRRNNVYRVPVRDHNNRPPQNGYDIITTLDVRIQDIMERELRARMASSQGALGTGAIEGTAIVMEVKTGAIRAVANLTRQPDGSFADTENHAIAMRCEPGSTFKLVPLLSLLNDGWDINRIIDCGNGKYTDPNGNYVEDSHTGDHAVGRANIKRIFEQSSNVGFVKMVEATYWDDPQRYIDFIRSIGLDTVYSMQLRGAKAAIVKDPRITAQNDFRRWDRSISLMKMAYGYAVEITPLHTLTLYNAIANDGIMMQPYLVEELRRSNDRISTDYPRRAIPKPICSPQDLAFVRSCLEGVIHNNGTGRAAASRLYTAAGKTGTAQVNQPGIGYVDRNGGMYYLASFVGYFPADKPEYTIIVAVKTYWRPGVGAERYGAEFGVPVFRAMADQVFSTFSKRETTLTERSTPDTILIKGGRAREIAALSRRFGVSVGVVESADGWLRTSQTGTATSVAEVEMASGIMPDITGMGLKDALYILERAGLKVRVTGYGAVFTQSPQAGEAIAEGQQAEIKLRVEN